MLMPDAETPSEPLRDLDYAQARLAYSIIESLLEHTRVVSDLVALMAQVLDEETTKAVTQTPRGSMIVAPSSKPPTTLNARVAESFVVGRGRHCDLPTQAASREILRQGRGELLSAQSTSSLVITSGGAIRIVCSWVSLARMTLPSRLHLRQDLRRPSRSAITASGVNSGFWPRSSIARSRPRERSATRSSGLTEGSVMDAFDRFWQSSRTDRQGAGLGLAITKGIIDAHGGSIWAASRPGHGSTFYFTLPVSKSSA